MPPVNCKLFQRPAEKQAAPEPLLFAIRNPVSRLVPIRDVEDFVDSFQVLFAEDTRVYENNCDRAGQNRRNAKDKTQRAFRA